VTTNPAWREYSAARERNNKKIGVPGAAGESN
jgi:hypothetical protein